MVQDGTNQDDEGSAFAGVEYKRIGYSLFVAFSGDKMECRCGYLPRESGSPITLTDLCQFLAQANVKIGIDQEELERLVAAAAGRQTVRDLVVARGVPTVKGSDGYFLATAKPSIRAHHEGDEGDAPDFRNVQTFVNVLPGDEIGRLVPNRAGVPGRKVTGEVAIPKHGRPLKLKIGPNVAADEQGEVLFAAAAGRVWHAGDEISVVQEYRVAGDVDFRVGSVDFNGVVEVHGDVLDGFNVTATKGVHVHGNIGNGSINCQGDVAICGMDGHGTGSIVCQGNLRANYLHDCRVECAGDVIVQTEIHNSSIFALGRVVVKMGGAWGGTASRWGGSKPASSVPSPPPLPGLPPASTTATSWNSNSCRPTWRRTIN